MEVASRYINIFCVFFGLLCNSWVVFSAQPHQLLRLPSQKFENKDQVSRERMVQVLNQATSLIWTEQSAEGYWHYPSHLGLMYISQYYLMSYWLGLEKKTSLQPEILKNLILKSQLKDGSWEILHDENWIHGSIDATIYHYWTLKVMGVSLNDVVMKKAQAFVLKNGGLKKSSLFTQVFLSLFGNLSWENFPSIPYFLFENMGPLRSNQFAQWVVPHLVSIAYLKRNQVDKDFGPSFHLPELLLDSSDSMRSLYLKSSTEDFVDSSDLWIMRAILAKQKPHGSFGGYTSATLLALTVMDHLLAQGGMSESFRAHLQISSSDGFKFIEEMYFKNPNGAYQGVTCDGRYWDTMLVGQGLLEAGINPKLMDKSIKYIESTQNLKSGGYSFGYDFESYEDTDDTAEVLLFFKRARYDNGDHHQKALDWLVRMQNSDGGWGAFDKDNSGNFLLKEFASDFLDSADLFDESSADVTGHILEALGSYNYCLHERCRSEGIKVVKSAVSYLRKTQLSSFGGWEGRWGVNYLYGTSAAVIGLLKVGVPATDSMVVKALDWLEFCSSSHDGGYGESFQSYRDDFFRCGGKSTATQTALVLMALVEGGRAQSPKALAAASFLIRQFEKDGNFTDSSFVGTGHPRIVPMSYPAYPKAFPLMALSRYLKATRTATTVLSK